MLCLLLSFFLLEMLHTIGDFRLFSYFSIFFFRFKHQLTNCLTSVKEFCNGKNTQIIEKKGKINTSYKRP